MPSKYTYSRQDNVPTTGPQSAGPLPPARVNPASGGQRTPLQPDTHTRPQPAPSGKAGQAENIRLQSK